MIRAALVARCDDDEALSVNDADCYVLSDAKKEGATHSNLLAGFCTDEGKPINKHTRKIHVLTEEETLAKRRGR
eukprot:8753666-Pyramimonas_sp.AAC.1